MDLAYPIYISGIVALIFGLLMSLYLYIKYEKLRKALILSLIWSLPLWIIFLPWLPHLRSNLQEFENLISIIVFPYTIWANIIWSILDSSIQGGIFYIIVFGFFTSLMIVCLLLGLGKKWKTVSMAKEAIIVFIALIQSLLFSWKVNSQPTPTPPPQPLPPLTPEPFLIQILRLPYIWGLLILTIIAISIYVSFTRPSKKHIWRKSIIYGLIWSVPYIILIYTTNNWWSNDLLRNVFQSIGKLIWLPFTIWEHFLPNLFLFLKIKGNPYVHMILVNIFGIITSIFIIHIILKIRR